MNIFKVIIEKDIDDTLSIFIIEYEVISGTDSPRTACKPLADYTIENNRIVKIAEFNVNYSIFLDSKDILEGNLFEKYYGLTNSLFSFSFIVTELEYSNIQSKIESAFLQITQEFIVMKNKFKNHHSIFENI